MNTHMQDLIKQWQSWYKKSRRIPGSQMDAHKEIIQQQERIVQELACLIDPTAELAQWCPICREKLKPFSLFCSAGHLRFPIPGGSTPLPGVIFPKFRRIKPQDWHFLDIGKVKHNKSLAETYYRNNKSLTGVETHIEEFVRQWVIQVLIDTYHYPRRWIGTQLSIEEQVQMGTRYCYADIALKNRRGEPFLFVETKVAKATLKELQQAEGQLKSYLSATHSAMLGIVTDGHTTILLQKHNNPNTFTSITNLPTVEDALKSGLIDQRDLEDDTDLSISKEEENLLVVPTTGNNSPLTYPSVQQYIAAFRAIASDISANQRTMLKVHYHAPHHTMTMTELAQSVGYASYRGANLQYGRLGSLLCDKLKWQHSISISVLVGFISPDQSPNGQWLLILHPEVVAALEQIRWI